MISALNGFMHSSSVWVVAPYFPDTRPAANAKADDKIVCSISVNLPWNSHACATVSLGADSLAIHEHVPRMTEARSNNQQMTMATSMKLHFW
jgi:hypothetical protein